MGAVVYLPAHMACGGPLEPVAPRPNAAPRPQVWASGPAVQ
jgi:hypothetical protein